MMRRARKSYTSSKEIFWRFILAEMLETRLIRLSNRTSGTWPSRSLRSFPSASFSTRSPAARRFSIRVMTSWYFSGSRW